MIDLSMLRIITKVMMVYMVIDMLPLLVDYDAK